MAFPNQIERNTPRLILARLKVVAPQNLSVFQLFFFPSAVSAQGELTGFTCQDLIWVLRILFSSCMRRWNHRHLSRVEGTSLSDFIGSCRNNSSLKAWINVSEGSLWTNSFGTILFYTFLISKYIYFVDNLDCYKLYLK